MIEFKDLTISLVILQILDILSTYIGITNGFASEANFLLNSFTKIIFMKLVMIFLIITIYILSKNHFEKTEKKLFKNTYMAFNYIYGFILLNNIMIVFAGFY